MARRVVRAAGKAARVTTATPAPAARPLPPAVLHVSTTVWPRHEPIHRIHQSLYAPAAFNPGVSGNARFSPIKNKDGDPIPTLYGGTTFECAAMETVFHDVPFAPGFKSLDKRKLKGQVHSVVLPADDLVLLDLSSVALRKLGLRRNQLIDTEKDLYPDTRKWAEAFHAQCPHIKGLCWISRQDDRARAAVFFGDRIGLGTLSPRGDSRDVLLDLDAYAEVLALADKIGVRLIAGRS
jgi:hypothetical protein